MDRHRSFSGVPPLVALLLLVLGAFALATVAPSTARAQPSLHPANAGVYPSSLAQKPLIRIAVIPFTVLRAPSMQTLRLSIGLDELLRQRLLCDFRFDVVGIDRLRQAAVQIPSHGGIGPKEAAIVARRLGAKFIAYGTIRYAHQTIVLTGSWRAGGANIATVNVTIDARDPQAGLVYFAAKLAAALPYAEGHGPTATEQELARLPFGSSLPNFMEYTDGRIAYWRGDYAEALRLAVKAYEGDPEGRFAKDESLRQALVLQAEAIKRMLAAARTPEAATAALTEATKTEALLDQAVSAHPKEYWLAWAMATLLAQHAATGESAERITREQAGALREGAQTLIGSILRVRTNWLGAHIALVRGVGYEVVHQMYPDVRQWSVALQDRARYAAYVLGPDRPEGYVLFGLAYFESSMARRGTPAGEADAQKGLNMLSQAASRFPDDPFAVLPYVEQLVLQHTLDGLTKAAEPLARLLAADPGDPALRFWAFKLDFDRIALQKRAPSAAELEALYTNALAYYALFDPIAGGVRFARDIETFLFGPEGAAAPKAERVQALKRQYRHQREVLELEPGNLDTLLITWGLATRFFATTPDAAQVAAECARAYREHGGTGLAPLLASDPDRHPFRRFTPPLAQ